MVSTISKREYPNFLFQNNNFVKKLIGFVGLLVSPWLFHSSEQIHAPTKSRKLFIFSSFYNTNTCIVYVTCRTIQKIIRGRIFVTHTTREWDINHPGAPAERENSPHLKERSVRSRTTSPPFTWQSRIPHSLRTHLTVFVYNVLLLTPPPSLSPYTAELELADSQRWFPVPTVRAR